MLKPEQNDRLMGKIDSSETRPCMYQNVLYKTVVFQVSGGSE